MLVAQRNVWVHNDLFLQSLDAWWSNSLYVPHDGTHSREWRWIELQAVSTATQRLDETQRMKENALGDLLRRRLRQYWERLAYVHIRERPKYIPTERGYAPTKG